MTLQTTDPAVSLAHKGITVSGANKSYGNTDVLKQLDMQIAGGEFVTLLGPSGSGKSTLLNVISGLDSLDSGTITVGGRDMTEVPAHKRGFGMVFQSYALFPHKSVAENVAYPLQIRRLPKTEMKMRVIEALQLVHLEHMADRLPSQLSGGQQQRVSLARALVFRPDVLLMDEPLGALDRNLRQSLQFEIRKLQREIGSTVIYVTHDHDEALSMSDRVALMNGGVIVQMDPPSELYRNPRNAYVAAAFGETSLLPVTIQHSADGSITARLLQTDQSVTVLSNPAHTATNGSGMLAVRPEMISLTSPSSDAAHLVGTLTSSAFMGSVWRFEVQLGNNTVIASNPSTAADMHNPGDPVGLTLDTSSVRLVSLDN